MHGNLSEGYLRTNDFDCSNDIILFLSTQFFSERKEGLFASVLNIHTGTVHSLYYALINLAQGPCQEIFALTFKVHCVRSIPLARHDKYFMYGPNSG